MIDAPKAGRALRTCGGRVLAPGDSGGGGCPGGVDNGKLAPASATPAVR